MKTLTSSRFILSVIHQDKLIVAEHIYFWSDLIAGYEGEYACAFRILFTLLFQSFKG